MLLCHVILSYSYRVCYTTKFKNNNCTLRNRKFELIDATLIGKTTVYDIKTPTEDGGVYPDKTLCTYSLPPRQFNHEYFFLYPTPLDIEESIIPFRCLDSLLYEHTVKGMSTKRTLICGNHVPKSGYVMSDIISMTFRSNNKVKHKGANFFVLESAIEVYCVVYLMPVWWNIVDASVTG